MHAAAINGDEVVIPILLAARYDAGQARATPA
jgi:hypothetical protein